MSAHEDEYEEKHNAIQARIDAMVRRAAGEIDEPPKAAYRVRAGRRAYATQIYREALEDLIELHKFSHPDFTPRQINRDVEDYLERMLGTDDFSQLVDESPDMAKEAIRMARNIALRSRTDINDLPSKPVNPVKIVQPDTSKRPSPSRQRILYRSVPTDTE